MYTWTITSKLFTKSYHFYHRIWIVTIPKYLLVRWIAWTNSKLHQITCCKTTRLNVIICVYNKWRDRPMLASSSFMTKAAWCNNWIRQWSDCITKLVGDKNVVRVKTGNVQTVWRIFQLNCKKVRTLKVGKTKLDNNSKWLWRRSWLSYGILYTVLEYSELESTIAYQIIIVKNVMIKHEFRRSIYWTLLYLTTITLCIPRC